MSPIFFFFNDTATTEIYTLSLHDALPIWEPPRRHRPRRPRPARHARRQGVRALRLAAAREDRKSTRLNSSHANISYAVFCLKKKKTTKDNCTLSSIDERATTNTASSEEKR